MTQPETVLIPPPTVVRAQLARNIREGRLLRSLYKLSVRAAVERESMIRRATRTTATGDATR